MGGWTGRGKDDIIWDGDVYAKNHFGNFFGGVFTTSGKGTFGELQVDFINIDGNRITSSNGDINLTNDNLATTGYLVSPTLHLDDPFFYNEKTITASGDNILIQSVMGNLEFYGVQINFNGFAQFFGEAEFVNNVIFDLDNGSDLYFESTRSSGVAVAFNGGGYDVNFGNGTGNFNYSANVLMNGTSQLQFNDTNTYLVYNSGDIDIYTAADKTIELQTPVYDDLQFAISGAKVPAANYPNWETFTTSTEEYAFSVGDYIYSSANELPHWWKQGTLGDAHLHFTIKTAQNTGSNRYAKFEVVFAYADVNEVWVEQTLTGEKTIPTGTAALTNLYVDLGNITLTNYLIGAQVKARIKRIAATGGTEYADDVYITQCGIHLQKDTLGSRTETAK